MAHFEIFPDGARYGYRLRADSDEVVYSSDERYDQATDARVGIEDLTRAVLSTATSTSLTRSGWGQMGQLPIDVREVAV